MAVRYTLAIGQMFWLYIDLRIVRSFILQLGAPLIDSNDGRRAWVSSRCSSTARVPSNTGAAACVTMNEIRSHG